MNQKEYEELKQKIAKIADNELIDELDCLIQEKEKRNVDSKL